jgi:hypothetical protein
METKHIKYENTRNTLETPVWGKPTKEGILLELQRNFCSRNFPENLTA